MRLTAAQVNSRRETARTVLRIGGVLLAAWSLMLIGIGIVEFVAPMYGSVFAIHQFVHGAVYLGLGTVCITANRAFARWAVPAQLTARCPNCWYEVSSEERCPECGLDLADGVSRGSTFDSKKEQTIVIRRKYVLPAWFCVLVSIAFLAQIVLMIFAWSNYERMGTAIVLGLFISGGLAAAAWLQYLSAWERAFDVLRRQHRPGPDMPETPPGESQLPPQ